MTSLLAELPSTPFAIVMPDEFSEVTDAVAKAEGQTTQMRPPDEEVREMRLLRQLATLVSL